MTSIRRVLVGVDGWLFPLAPPQPLAALRVLVSGFTLAYLTIRLPVFWALRRVEPARLDPVGVLAWLNGPFPGGVVVGVIVVALVTGAMATLGSRQRVAGPTFALACLVLFTYRSSFGQVLWFEHLMVLHLLIVGFARSGDALSMDARRRRAQADVDDVAASVAYGWPVRLAALVTVVTYVLAGIAKLRIGGWGWLDGETLRRHIAFSATRLGVLGERPSPLAAPIVRHAWLFAPVGAAVVALELLAPVALVGGRLRGAWVAAAWAMHAGIAVTMSVVFPYPLGLVAFAPLFALDAASWRWRLPRRRVAP